MTHITHHPPEDMLLGYANGRLEAGFNLVLATHVSMCSHCQQTVRLYEGLGGEILENLEPVEMQSSAADALALIHGGAPKQVSEYAIANNEDNLPSVLHDALGAPLESLKWQKLGPGLRQHIIKLPGKAIARLIWIAQGVAVPSHSHRGDELTLALSGGYYANDLSFTKGDVQWTDQTDPHQPRAMDDGPCLTLAVTDAPIKFENLIPRLLQPFFKI